MYKIPVIITCITDRLFWFFTGECRTLREDNYQLQRIRRDDKSSDSLPKNAVSDEDEASEGQDGSSDSGGVNTVPSLLTSGLVVETIEGTTVNLPCKVANISGK